MPAVPAKLEVALRGLGCVHVKIEDDPVKVALYDEFQRLINLYTHWDVAKKREKSKSFKPEDVARKAHAALKDRRAAAASKNETEEAAPTPAIHHTLSPANYGNASAAQKRSRAMSEVCGSNVGVSGSPSRELRTKAARRKDGIVEDKPVTIEEMRSPQECLLDAKCQPADASASDTMALSPVNGLVDSCAAEPNSHAEAPIDEEMAPVQEHIEEGAFTGAKGVPEADAAHNPATFSPRCVEPVQPSDDVVASASRGVTGASEVKRLSVLPGADQSNRQAQGLSPKDKHAEGESSPHPESAVQANGDVVSKLDTHPQPEDASGGEAAELSPVTAMVEACTDALVVQADVQTDEIMSPRDERRASQASPTTEVVDVDATGPVEIPEDAPTASCAEPAQPLPCMDAAPGASADNGLVDASEVKFSNRASVAVQSQKLSECFPEDDTAEDIDLKPAKESVAAEAEDQSAAVLEAATPEATGVERFTKTPMTVQSETQSAGALGAATPKALEVECPQQASAVAQSEKQSAGFAEATAPQSSEVKLSGQVSVAAQSEKLFECFHQTISREALEVKLSEQASAAPESGKLSESFPDENMSAKGELSPCQEPSMKAEIVCSTEQDELAHPEPSSDAGPSESSPVFALVETTGAALGAPADYADENMAPVDECNGAAVPPDATAEENAEAVNTEEHAVNIENIHCTVPLSGGRQKSLSMGVEPEASERNVIAFAPAVAIGPQMLEAPQPGATPGFDVVRADAPIELDAAVCSLQEYAKDAQRHSEDTSAAEAPAHTGPQWWTPIFHDDGEGQEEVPAWSSDGGSAQENGDAAGADDMREDDMPLCDERAGVDVVDLHELAPHETPTPLPVGVWSQAAEQAAEVDLGSHRLQQLPCERPQLGLQPVCELTPHKTPKLSSGVKSQPGDDGAQVELDGHQIPVVLEDAERGMPSTPKFCEGGAGVAPTCEELPAEETQAEPVQASNAVPSIPSVQGGLLAQIRSKMLAQKAAAAEKEPKRAKQPIAALAKAAKVKQEQQKVQEEREARKKALEQERTAQKQKAAAFTAQIKKPVLKETRIPTTPTARKVLQELKQPQGQPPFIPGCKTPGGFPMPTPSTLHNNVNATPRAANMAGTGIPGSAGPRRWRVPTPGPQYPITPEEELEDSEDDEASEAREQKLAKFQAQWATMDKLKQAVQLQKFTDPESIFGTFAPSCDLMELMAPIKSEKEEMKYTARRKSRNWGADAITQAEISSFARKKGYRLL